MDFVITIALALLTPFALNHSKVDYVPVAGIFVTDNDATFGFNAYEGQSVMAGNRNDKTVVKTDFIGMNSVLYEPYVEYVVKLGSSRRMWIAPRFSYQPLRDEVNLTLKAQSSSRAEEVQMVFNELPGMGLGLGYDLIMFNPKRFFRFGLSPYVGLSFNRVGYISKTKEEVTSLLDSVTKIYAGANFQLDSNWHVNIEYNTYTVNVYGDDVIGQNIDLSVNKIKLSVAYYFVTKTEENRSIKDVSYHQIIESIDPYINNKMEETKKIQRDKSVSERQQELEDKKAAKADVPSNTTANASPPSNATSQSQANNSNEVVPVPPSEPTNTTEDWSF